MGEDVVMEAEDKCTVPQVKDCRYLWKLDKVGAGSPVALLVGTCLSEPLDLRISAQENS